MKILIRFFFEEMFTIIRFCYSNEIKLIFRGKWNVKRSKVLYGTDFWKSLQFLKVTIIMLTCWLLLPLSA